MATGCYVQTATEKIKEDLAIDIVVGNNKKKDIVNILKEYFEDKEKSFVIDINNTDEYEDFEVATVLSLIHIWKCLLEMYWKIQKCRKNLKQRNMTLLWQTFWLT